MNEEGLSFLKVSELCRKSVVTCREDEDVVSVAGRMQERSISGVVVCRGREPVGVITDRDIRNRLREILACGGQTPASGIMSSQLVTVGLDDYLFEAIYLMARHRIHRLVVVDGDGNLAGILTNTDVIKAQVSTPLYVGRDIEEATTVSELRGVNGRIAGVVSHACRTGARTRDIIRLIAHFHDTIGQKVIEIVLRESAEPVPDRFAFLALGSEGRGEQTLKTDQDNALVYADDLTEKEVACLEDFSARLIDARIAIGVPPCPGGVMANNPLWRRTVTEWSRNVESWILVPTPEDIVNFGMFCDLRTLFGRPEYERHLKETMLRAVRQNTLFLAYMARKATTLSDSPPLGMFGRLKVERTGEHKGAMDLKKAGIFAITEGVTLLALEAGVLDGGTWEKIEALRGRATLSDRNLEQIDQAFGFLTYLRLQRQLGLVQAGLPPDNYINPSELSDTHRGRLKEALATVEFLQRHIKDQYHLDQIPH